MKPGSPWQNGYVESLIAKLGDESLKREVFTNGQEAWGIVESWREGYNNCRPNISLAYLMPAQLATRCHEKNWA